MKRKSALSIAILCFFLLTTTGNAQDFFKRFSLKLASGFGNTTGGDMNNLIEGINEQVADLAGIYGLTLPGAIENINWGLGFEAELVLSFSENFGVGLGVGYLERKKESSTELRLDSLMRVAFSWEPTYTAIPITLSGYYYYPISSKMDAFVKAGIGYYSAKIKFETLEETEVFGYSEEWERNEGETKDNGLGFHGGLGLEYNITENIALYAEGMGRHAKFKNWEVDNTHTTSWGTNIKESGTFWYVEEYEEETGRYYPTMILSEQRPSDPNLRNVRKAELSFSGFSFRIGVKIRFGK